LVLVFALTNKTAENTSLQEGEGTSKNMPVNDGAEQGTTLFTKSVEAVSYDAHRSALDPMNDNDLESDDIKSIADFLAKPIDVASGSFNTSTSVGQLFSQDIFSLFNSQPIWTNKIQGFLNMRADVKLRLVINPTPFHAGLLRLSYFPCANQLAFESEMHTFDRITTSQLPGSYCSMASNFVEITVPYIAPTSYLERDQVFSNRHVSWGKVYLNLFQPLRTGAGPLTVNWTLWMSLENLDLSGMVQPQSVDVPRKRRGRAPCAQDAEMNSGKGPIGRIMSSGVKLANDVSAIPTLAPLAGPASWVLRALGGVCDAFGWSKPTLTEAPSKQIIGAHHYAVNSRGDDDSAPLSLDPENKIMPISDASPGGMDEMSFNFIKSRWSYAKTFQWDSTQSTTSLLWDTDVFPRAFAEVVSLGGNFVETTIPVGLLTEFYSNYRGSMEIRLRLLKTGFHTGTLAVGFVPGLRALTPTFAEAPYTYRQIIDIQDGTEFVFNCPYLLPQDFANVGQPMGRFYVHVVNPLVAPSTVSSTIDIMVEARAGNDLILTSPKSCNVSPFIPQGIDTENHGESTAVVLGSKKHMLKNLNHAQLANGELQLSVLEILKANHSIIFKSDAPSPTSSTVVTMAANRFTGVRYNATSTSTSVSEYGSDPLSMIGSMYALSRGGTRYRFVPLQYNNDRGLRAMILTQNSREEVNLGFGFTYNAMSAPVVGQDGYYYTLSSTDAALGESILSSRVYQSPQINGGYSVQVPFYSKYRYDLNHVAGESGVGNLRFTNNNSVAFSWLNTGKGLIMRSVADDYQLSFFVGVPCFVRSFPYYNKVS
jgi:hypothetical protein